MPSGDEESQLLLVENHTFVYRADCCKLRTCALAAAAAFLVYAGYTAWLYMHTTD